MREDSLPFSASSTSGEAAAVVAFWVDAGPSMWFAKDAAFDRRFSERFLAAHEAAARGELSAWQDSPTGGLALMLLLDQFPRNAFRGTPRVYATDALARMLAATAIAAGRDLAVAPALRLFFYLPYGHSEDRADQERAVVLTRELGGQAASSARQHCSIVQRFGRFPHRNAILGRPSTPEEQQFLDAGGFAG